MGEFKNDQKHGIGSSIEGVDLEHILQRILIPVKAQFANRNLDQQGKKRLQTSNNSYG
jgi:hypothetical protein